MNLISKRTVFGVALLAACGLNASAGVLTITDQINNTLFASAQYDLTADNMKVITSLFTDGNASASGTETTGKPNLLTPNKADAIIQPAGEALESADYALYYDFSLSVSRNRINTAAPSKAQTDPAFGVTNTNLDVTLVFKDIKGLTLQTVNVTNLSSLDLLPYLEDGGAVQAAFDTTGVFLRTRIRADSAVFTADLSGYDPVNHPDRNVQLDYQLQERLQASDSVFLQFTPEPVGTALVGLGLLGLARLYKKARKS
jgi:hypothetical protein